MSQLKNTCFSMFLFAILQLNVNSKLASVYEGVIGENIARILYSASFQYIISQKKKRVHLVTSKSLIEKYSNSLKGSRSYRKKISNFAVAASSNCEQNAGGEQLPNMEGDNDERDFAHLVPFCPIGGSAGDSSEALMDYWDSDEERMDSLPISKFRPEFIENDIETRSMTTAVNEPLK